ncbi:hypothetical protein AAFN86_00210 [Roseomonas sp. CAU 1739]|uniref:hypothetical protein n=1 Tax=Roseomonas sp. CAU 1739 TaxID=3140364 RepID=UPI00325B2B8E
MDLPAAFAACRTEADFYRVQVPAENVMTPCEVETLAAQAGGLPEPAQGWIRRLRFQMRRVHPAPEPYRRRPLADHVILYEGEGPADAPRDLVLAMAGIGMRLMMPVATVLQALPADRCDIILMSDPGMAGFLRGVPGYAEDPVALVARLAQDVPLARYRAVRAFGTSVGGAAALCYGALLGGTVALSLGGAHPPALPLRRAVGELDRRIFDRLHAGLVENRTRMICAFGAENPLDALRSRLLRFTRPGSRALAVAGLEEHGVLLGLLRKNAMRRFFAELLLSDTAWPNEVWQP